MPKLDGLKERSVYLRLLMGIVIVAEVSLVGWVASAAETATPRLFALGVVGIIVLGLGAFLLHRQIERLIAAIRDL
jgi:hypothetical protein